MNAGEGEVSSETERLREALAAANERLALYEGFDHLIEDQVRRTGEALREVVELREQAANGIVSSRRARVEAGLVSISSEIGRISASLDGVSHQVQAMLDAVRTDFASSAVPVAPVSTPGDGSAVPQVGSATDLIVHDVIDTSMAVSIQRHVLGLSAVDSAEVREFAEGVLRLRLALDAPLHASDFEGWEIMPGLRPLYLSSGVIELVVGDDTTAASTGTNSSE